MPSPPQAASLSPPPGGRPLPTRGRGGAQVGGEGVSSAAARARPPAHTPLPRRLCTCLCARGGRWGGRWGASCRGGLWPVSRQ